MLTLADIVPAVHGSAGNSREHHDVADTCGRQAVQRTAIRLRRVIRPTRRCQSAFDISRNDQVQCGIMLIDLFKMQIQQFYRANAALPE